MTVRKRDTDRGVEPPSALYSSRTKEITEEATITIGFTFFRTREPAEEVRPSPKKKILQKFFKKYMIFPHLFLLNFS